MRANIDHPSGQLRPAWRGRLHATAAPVAIAAGALLVIFADGTSGRVAAAVFAVALAAVYAVSGTYHRLVCTPQTQQTLRRLDHAMIFVLIAGTYTPVCLLALPSAWGVPLLAFAWLGAACGVVLCLRWKARRFSNSLYLILGWGAIAVVPASLAGGLNVSLILLAAGGIAYTVGAVLFFTNRPRLAPTTFGYHEVWHAFTIAAGVTHFAAVGLLVA